MAATHKIPFVHASSLAIDVATMRLVPEAVTIADETRVVLDRVAARLSRHGLTLGDVVKATCYLSDEAHLDEFIDAYDTAFASAPLPVTTMVVLGLAGDCRVQIEVVAAR
ncbi:RidA family protein [Streptomyces fractus]|uniref:RidA family protein n=1 Tax=Streptomyces fractus TaxID=641806 RepID=UPI003CF33E43